MCIHYLEDSPPFPAFAYLCKCGQIPIQTTITLFFYLGENYALWVAFSYSLSPPYTFFFYDVLPLRWVWFSFMLFCLCILFSFPPCCFAFAFAFCLCFRLVIHFYYTPFYFTIAIPKIVNNGDSNFWMDCSQVDTCQKLIFVFALGVYNIDIDITHSNSITQSTRHTYK